MNTVPIGGRWERFVMEVSPWANPYYPLLSSITNVQVPCLLLCHKFRQLCIVPQFCVLLLQLLGMETNPIQLPRVAMALLDHCVPEVGMRWCAFLLALCRRFLASGARLLYLNPRAGPYWAKQQRLACLTQLWKEKNETSSLHVSLQRVNLFFAFALQALLHGGMTAFWCIT